MAAEGIITHVLNDAAAVGEGVGFIKVILGRVGEALQQQLLKGRVPCRIDNRFVSQNRVGMERRAQREATQEAGNHGPVTAVAAASISSILYSCLLYTSPSPRDRQKS